MRVVLSGAALRQTPRTRLHALGAIDATEILMVETTVLEDATTARDVALFGEIASAVDAPGSQTTTSVASEYQPGGPAMCSMRWVQVYG